MSDPNFLNFVAAYRKPNFQNSMESYSLNGALYNFFLPKQLDLLNLKRKLLNIPDYSEEGKNLILNNKNDFINFSTVNSDSKKELDYKLNTIFPNILTPYKKNRDFFKLPKYNSYSHNYRTQNTDPFYLTLLEKSIKPFIMNIDSIDDIHGEIDKILEDYIQLHIEKKRSEYGYSYDKILNILENDEDKINELFYSFSICCIVLDKHLDNEELDELFKPDSSHKRKHQHIHTYHDESSNVKYHLLYDGSMMTSIDGEYQPVHPFQSSVIPRKLQFDYIKKEFRKTPKIINEIVSHFGDEKYGLYETKSFNELLNFKKTIIEERNLMKQLNISVIDLFKEHHSVERIRDDINEAKLNNQAKQKMKSFLNKKTYYLLTDENIAIFRTLNEKEVTREQCQNHVFNNIAHYQLKCDETEEDIENKYSSFRHSLLTLKNKILEGFDANFYYDKMEDNNHLGNIIYNENNVMIYKVKTAEESLLYGNNTWCISRKDSYEDYFHKYKGENKYQYFYYNFVAESDNDMMIGITTERDGTPTESFDNRNDCYLKDENLKNIIDIIKEHDESINIKKNKKSNKNIGF